MKRLFFFIIIFLCLTGTNAAHARPLQYLYAYHHNGFYDRDVADTYKEALNYIAGHHSHVRKAAIVLDIDETSLSNWKQLKKNNLTLVSQSGHRYEAGSAIPGALALFNYAKAHNIGVIFLSGRSEKQEKETAQNLIQAGFQGWTNLILRPLIPGTPTTNAVFKAQARERLERKDGYTIIATIGDQMSDLSGGHSGETFRIPNPFYTLK